MKRRAIFRAGLVGLSALALAAASLAQPTTPAQPPDPAPAPSPDPATQAGQPSPTLHGELALSLEEALAMGIENNLDVEVVRHDPLISTERAIAAWGAYDPQLFGEGFYRSFDIPVANSLQRSTALKQRETGGLGGVRGVLPKVGWSYEVGYAGQSLESTSAIQSLSPQYTTDLSAAVTLPLLKGFLWGAAWTQVKTTKIVEGASYQDFRRQLMDVISDIEGAYWELIASDEALRVANKSLETATALKGQTEAQYEVGVVSRVEVVEAEAGVADRDFNRVVAQNRYLSAQDSLIDLVLGPHLTPDSRLEIRPTTAPDVVDYQIDEEQAARKAFEYRPELEIAQAEVERREIGVKFAKNQRLPQLDVVGTYGFQGLSGRTNPADDIFGGPRPPIDISRSYWGADDDFFGPDGAKNWTAGGLLSFPIGKIKERADVRASKLELRRARTQVRRVEQDVILEVRGAIRDLRSSIEGLEAAEERVNAAQEQLRAETVRLEHGESTPFDVLLREEDLVEAESQKIRALQAYRNSLTQLDRSQGTILRDRGIVVEDALALR
jgi:outer membrane protein